MVKKIIVFAHAGLANRLKCLISGMRLADKLERELVLCWPKNRHLGANFSDLFENKIKEVPFDYFEKIHAKHRERWVREGSVSKEYLNREEFVIWGGNFILLKGEVKEGFAKEFPNKKGDNIDFEFERIPEKIKKGFLNYVKKIKPKKDILDKVDKFNFKNKIGCCYGVHIRRGDFSSVLGGLGKVSRDELFIKEMENIIKKDPKAKFFVSTDSKKTEERLKEKFFGKIQIFDKRGAGRGGVLEAKEALIDLILLSKTKEILATYGSTFNEFAWWFGGCKSKVRVIGIEKEKQKVQENIKKLKKTNKIELFVRRKLNSLVRIFKGESI